MEDNINLVEQEEERLTNGMGAIKANLTETIVNLQASMEGVTNYNTEKSETNIEAMVDAQVQLKVDRQKDRASARASSAEILQLLKCEMKGRVEPSTQQRERRTWKEEEVDPNFNGAEAARKAADRRTNEVQNSYMANGGAEYTEAAFSALSGDIQMSPTEKRGYR